MRLHVHNLCISIGLAVVFTALEWRDHPRVTFTFAVLMAFLAGGSVACIGILYYLRRAEQ